VGSNLNAVMAKARKAQLKRQEREERNYASPHQARAEADDAVIPTIGQELSESELLDLAAIHYVVSNYEPYHHLRTLREPSERSAYVLSFRPKKVTDVFPRFDLITEEDRASLLRGVDPFINYSPVTGDDVHRPGIEKPGMKRDRVGTLGIVPTLLLDAVGRRKKQQHRAKEDMLSRLRGIPNEEGSGGAYDRGYWNKAEQIRNLPPEDLLIGLTTGKLYGEDFLGTGASREIGDIHSRFIPGYTTMPAGKGSRRGAHTGSPFRPEENLMPRGEELTELAERLGGLELQQYLFKRSADNKVKFMRLQEKAQKGEISFEDAQKEGLRILGMDEGAPNAPAPQQQESPAQQQTQVQTPLQGIMQPQPAPQTPSRPTRRSYKRNSMTGEYLYPEEN